MAHLFATGYFPSLLHILKWLTFTADLNVKLNSVQASLGFIIFL